MLAPDPGAPSGVTPGTSGGPPGKSMSMSSPSSLYRGIGALSRNSSGMSSKASLGMMWVSQSMITVLSSWSNQYAISAVGQPWQPCPSGTA